jgi:hypothetical protein
MSLKGDRVSHAGGSNISMKNIERLSLEQIRAFLQAREEVQIEATERVEIYGWMTRMLCHQEYWKQIIHCCQEG